MPLLLFVLERRVPKVACELSAVHFVDDFLASGATKEEAEATLFVMVQEVGLKCLQQKEKLDREWCSYGCCLIRLK